MYLRCDLANYMPHFSPKKILPPLKHRPSYGLARPPLTFHFYQQPTYNLYCKLKTATDGVTEATLTCLYAIYVMIGITVVSNL